MHVSTSLVQCVHSIPAEEKIGLVSPSIERGSTMIDTIAQSAIDHPHFISGPWTDEARTRAIQDEVREAYISYFRKAVKTRNWFPWDDLPLNEMKERGHLLSEDTITMIEAFLGIEDYIGDYVEDAINIVRGDRERRNI